MAQQLSLLLICMADINQEGFPIFSFNLPILRLLDWNKDILMYSNQVYNLIQIGWNNPEKDSGESNRAKYARVIYDLPRNIDFHVNNLT